MSISVRSLHEPPKERSHSHRSVGKGQQPEQQESRERSKETEERGSREGQKPRMGKITREEDRGEGQNLRHRGQSDREPDSRASAIATSKGRERRVARVIHACNRRQRDTCIKE